MWTKLTVVIVILTSVTSAKKLIVTTGFTQTTEVIDIDEASNICNNLQDFPVVDPFGLSGVGLNDNEFPLACGGCQVW